MLVYKLLTFIVMVSCYLARIVRSSIKFRFNHHNAFRASYLNSNEHMNMNMYQHVFSVAPMMEYTDRHMRFLMRLISSKSTLYTEMVTANALIRTDEPKRFLEAEFGVENPLVLQLGGACPVQIKEASKIAVRAGYQEINLNVGCPSDKVAGAGCFGAALMLKPDLVAELAVAIGEATGRPATVKCRIGVDDADSYEHLADFVRRVSDVGGVQHFIVHARKAVLGANFSPEYNRKVPPLKYDMVYQLVRDFSHLSFSINGGVQTYDETKEHLRHGVLGVMCGRAVVNNPFYWRHVDSILYNSTDPGFNRREILAKYSSYCEDIEREQGKRVRRALLKPVLNMFTGEPNGKVFRCLLDDYIRDSDVSVGAVIFKASGCLADSILDLKDAQ